MDATLLTTNEFWVDPAPVGRGIVPDLPELSGHVLFETSGSSGTPKWVALSKRSLLESAVAVNRHLDVNHSSRWGLALPLHHVGGFGVAARAFQAGAAISVFPGKWNPMDFQAWLQSEMITHTSLVPTQVHDLVAANLPSPATLQAIVVGGGKLESAPGQCARDLGWPVLASYGMTEACSQIATQTLASLRDSYHPAPLPLLPIWEARCADDSRIEISGPALFSGYVIDGKFQPRPSAWHLTADRAALDGRLLTPLGRVDTIVKVFGELVDPAAIGQEILQLCEQLAGKFVVLAMPDLRAGHILVPVFENQLPRELVDQALARYQATAPGFRRLQPPIFLPQLPRSELGKVRRAELQEILRLLD